MLTIALNNKLWLAYSTQTGSLYKAWTGRVSFDGSVYTAVHGVQPTTQGNTYMQEPDGNPWRLIVNNKEVIPVVNYKGHAITANKVTLSYEILYNGQKIRIEEKPEYVNLEDKTAGFERVFTTLGVPAGIKVALRINPSSLLSETDVITDGSFKAIKRSSEMLATKRFIILEGNLLLKSNSNTRLYIKFSAKPQLADTPQKKLTADDKLQALIARNDCSTCHNKEMKTVGPSYMAIAEQYDNTQSNHDMLVDKVIKGGAGNWGAIPMTPHPDLSKEDAGAIISYIQALEAGLFHFT
jgi:cytochrome c